MAEQVFLKLLNMSISASWLVLAVILLRFLLKKAPKWVNVALWGLVALRLVCPFSLESALSLIPSAQTIPAGIMLETSPAIDSGISSINSVVNPIIEESFTPSQFASANPLQIHMFIWAVLWLLGMAVMLLYAAVSYWALHRRLTTAVRLRDNIWQSEAVVSPFVLGIFAPKIYLPFRMDPRDMTHVIAHEQAHIRRRDHWWKPLGFLLLTLHWFNPLIWVAYILLCRDIELACDEKVIRDLDRDQRADYSQALLSCSVHRGLIAACPLAFGEVGVRTRVKNVLHYKKPAFWIILAGVLALAVTAVCFMTDPLSDDPVLENVTGQKGYQITAQETEDLDIMFYKNWLPEDIFSEEGHTFAENEIIVYETGTTRMYLRHAGFDDPAREYLIFTFDFSYDIPSSGTLLLPYQVDPESGATSGPSVSHEIMDAETLHLDAAYLRGQGPGEAVCVNIKTEIYEAANSFLQLHFSGLNLLSYVSDNGAADAVDRLYRVTEVVYQHPALSLTVSPDTAPYYSFSADFTLQSMAQDADSWMKYGTMEPLTLSAGNFDWHFETYENADGWPTGLSARQLRQENANAWYWYDPNTVWDTTYYLLQQKNGDVYLVQARGETGVIQRIFALTASGPGAAQAEVTLSNTYFCGTPDSIYYSSLTLYQDGTFHLIESLASSNYCHGTYALTGDELVMKTDDGKYTYYFTASGGSLIYDAARSAPISVLREGEKKLQPLPDGSVFSPIDRVTITVNLSLDDVLSLSAKRAELTWSDFEKFSCTDIGSGTYIRHYEIDPTFSLYVGGSSLDEPPAYIRLQEDATGEFIDIRKTDVSAFIRAHQQGTAEETAPAAETTPLEDIPKDYPHEQAAADGFVVYIYLGETVSVRNKDILDEFLQITEAGGASTFRFASYTLTEGSDYYAFFLKEVSYDGTAYTLRSPADGTVTQKIYRYLRHFDEDGMERYVLTNDPTATWEEIWESMTNSDLEKIDNYPIYAMPVDTPEYPTFSKLFNQ